MKIIFLDESGQPGGYNSEKQKLVNNTSKYFTLAGFMIDADNFLNIEKELKSIKLKYGLSDTHEVKWHTKYSKYGLTFEQYDNMRTEITQLISNYKNSVVASVMDKESCYRNKDYIKTPNDLYATALHLLMERYSMQVGSIRKLEDLKPIVIIADSRQSVNNNKLDKQLQLAYLRAKNMGTHFVKFPAFAEGIIFVDSDNFSGIQLADYCAGIIQKKYEFKDEKFFKVLEPGIRKHHSSIYGPGIKLYK